MLPPEMHSQQAGTMIPTLMLIPCAMPPSKVNVSAAMRKAGGAYVPQGSETGWEARHSIGSSREFRGRCW
jgi:hypothetical protein